MNCSITSVIYFLVVMAFANAQNLDSMEVETRDNPSAFLREKRQIINSLPQLAQIASARQLSISKILTPEVLEHYINSGCFWSGTAPFCSPECGPKNQAVLADSKGDGKLCWTGHKIFCCPLPAGMTSTKVKG